MVEILRVLQEAAIEVWGRGEEPLSTTTQETMMMMPFERYTISTVIVVDGIMMYIGMQLIAKKLVCSSLYYTPYHIVDLLFGTKRNLRHSTRDM